MLSIAAQPLLQLLVFSFAATLEEVQRMPLAAEEGSTIRVRTVGRDAEPALAALRELVDGKFGGEP